MPEAQAVYWETAEHFLPPARIIEMADEAMGDNWPLVSWLSFDIGQVDLGAGVVTPCGTRGLVPFKGHEISLVPAPMTIEQAFAMVATAVNMVTDRGHVFRDGETLGHDGQSPAQSLRIRRVPGDTGDGVTWDTVLLMHPDGPLTYQAYAGPMTERAPSAPSIKKRGEAGLFKRLVRAIRTS